MTKVVIAGSDDRARRLWEAFTLGGADVVAFVDDDPRRQGRAFLGSTIQPTSWLTSAYFDVLAVPAESDMAAATVLSAFALVDLEAVVLLPCDDDVALAAAVAASAPDPWSAAVARQRLPQGLRVGIFGTGAAAMKVWEALAERDDAEAVWFADNNPQQQGHPLLWLNVIAPGEISTRSIDVVVVASMSRDAIYNQLVDLGLPVSRILTPDVSGTVDQIGAALERSLERFRHEEVAR